MKAKQQILNFIISSHDPRFFSRRAKAHEAILHPWIATATPSIVKPLNHQQIIELPIIKPVYNNNTICSEISSPSPHQGFAPTVEERNNYNASPLTEVKDNATILAVPKIRKDNTTILAAPEIKKDNTTILAAPSKVEREKQPRSARRGSSVDSDVGCGFCFGGPSSSSSSSSSSKERMSFFSWSMTSMLRRLVAYIVSIMRGTNS